MTKLTATFRNLVNGPKNEDTGHAAFPCFNKCRFPIPHFPLNISMVLIVLIVTDIS